MLNNILYHPDFTLELPYVSFGKNIPNKLEHSLLSSNLILKKFDGKTFLVADTETYINSWNETGTPVSLVLKKKEQFSNSDEELSDETLLALSQQETNFIKLYPNPFVDHLIVSFDLKTTSNISVRVSDLYDNELSALVNNKQLPKGNYKYLFDGKSYKKGMYIVSVIVNGEKNSRVIVKK